MRGHNTNWDSVFDLLLMLDNLKIVKELWDRTHIGCYIDKWSI